MKLMHLTDHVTQQLHLINPEQLVNISTSKYPSIEEWCFVNTTTKSTIRVNKPLEEVEALWMEALHAEY